MVKVRHNMINIIRDELILSSFIPSLDFFITTFTCEKFSLPTNCEKLFLRLKFLSSVSDAIRI